MKETLEVRNFGPVRNLSVEIKPLTFFIGTQGSGKSTVSKLITIFRNTAALLKLSQPHSDISVINYFRFYSIDEYFQYDTYIKYNGQGTEFTYSQGILSFENQDFSSYCQFNSSVNFFEVLMNNTTLKRKVDKKNNGGHERKLKMTTYVPAERNLIGNLSSSLASIILAKVPLSDAIIQYMSFFEMAKKKFPKYEVPFLGVNYEKKDGRERIVVNSDGKNLPLEACSSGLQSVLPMVMVLDYVASGRFVIEEPEQNLFPENQCELLKFICSKKYRNNAQFVITTHSPYLLSCLNVLILAGKLYKDGAVAEKTKSVVPEYAAVNPADVAVYSLDPTAEECCRSIISDRTGLVSMNELDSISEVIGEDYDKLYRLYVESKRK